ncbi:MAG: 5-formyltetrahydrofolate cyclo-ligase [Maledivibacter sp.]|jgi:5-formyltetrahydrofolate cyclo-ligase|nr:5-formyltetrahydrofolate cyclo-ligase [Maledivibacter sp.]
MCTKDAMRNQFLKKRRKMKKEEAIKCSESIIHRLMGLKAFKESKNIMIYLSFNNEVDTYKLMEDCFNNGKRVIVPYCIKEERKIVPSEIKDPDIELKTSSLGFKEPDLANLREVETEDIDLVIVPGVIFDKSGNRIGFGGGYYDRFLKRLKNTTITIAICYDYQLIDKVPVDELDIPVGCIITDKRIVNIK